MKGGAAPRPDPGACEPPEWPRAVTIFATGAEGFGVRRCLADMAGGLDSRGIAVHFVLQTAQGRLADLLRTRGRPFAVVSENALPIVRGRRLGKALSMLARAIRQPFAARALARAVRRNGSGAILLCSPTETPAAAIAARFTGRTAFWMMPNEVSDYPLDLNRRIYRGLFRHGNLVPLANSRFTDASLGPGRFRRRVCHLGIDPGEFDPAARSGPGRARIGIPDDGIVIGLFARMVESKGQLQMLRAISNLGEEARDVHLLLCGGPQGTPYAHRVASEAVALGLAGRVHDLGEQDDMPGYYRLCDIVANARLDAEPFGLSVVEGMMLGKPVLAHRAGGPSETLIDGETGWLIASPGQPDFDAGLRRALEDRARWPQLGAQARQRALAHFTSGAMVDRVLAAMRDLR